jgi:hypothetical protein
MRIVAGIAILASLILCSCAEAAGGQLLGQPAFHVCVRPIRGVVYDMDLGLDADSGSARSGDGVVKIIIGGPSAFFDSPSVFIVPPSGSEGGRGRRIMVPPNIPGELALIGTTEDTKNGGAVALYGYSPAGAKLQGAQDPILVLLHASEGAASLKLMTAVGRALYRCD